MTPFSIFSFFEGAKTKKVLSCIIWWWWWWWLCKFFPSLPYRLSATRLMLNDKNVLRCLRVRLVSWLIERVRAKAKRERFNFVLSVVEHGRYLLCYRDEEEEEIRTEMSTGEVMVWRVCINAIQWRWRERNWTNRRRRRRGTLTMLFSLKMKRFRVSVKWWTKDVWANECRSKMINVNLITIFHRFYSSVIQIEK